MRRIVLSLFVCCTALLAADTFTQRQREFWSFQRVKTQTPPVVKHTKWVRTPIDSFIAAKLEAKGIEPAQPGRQNCPPPPRHLRSHRPAANARRSRRLPRRQLAASFRKSRRSPARLAAVRRALGPPLARPRPLRRKRRLQVRRNAPQRLALPRLRHPIAQRRQALQPLRRGADRRRRTVARESRGPRRHRLPPQLSRREQRPRAPAAPPGDSRRRDRRHRRRLHGPDVRMRTLPRSQIRPHPPGRLLPPTGLLRQHRGRRPHSHAARRSTRRIPPQARHLGRADRRYPRPNYRPSRAGETSRGQGVFR